jgi:hypothetical protein
MGKLGRAQHHGASKRNKRAKKTSDRELEQRIAEEAATHPVKTLRMCQRAKCDGSCGDVHRSQDR